MIFKMYNCDFGIKIDGVSYQFEHVNNLTIDNPELTRLTRGANAGNNIGLVYKEGLKEPKKLTVTIIGMTPELYTVLKKAYDEKLRLDFFCIDRGDGSSKMGRNAILSQEPQQMTLDDTPDSMNVSLIMETFDLTETHKQ